MCFSLPPRTQTMNAAAQRQHMRCEYVFVVCGAVVVTGLAVAVRAAESSATAPSPPTTFKCVMGGVLVCEHRERKSRADEKKIHIAKIQLIIKKNIRM